MPTVGKAGTPSNPVFGAHEENVALLAELVEPSLFRLISITSILGALCGAGFLRSALEGLDALFVN